MDFVATSQPDQDIGDVWDTGIHHTLLASPDSDSNWDDSSYDLADVVASSQPDEDGEELLPRQASSFAGRRITGAPSASFAETTACSPPRRSRPHLVRRASPVKLPTVTAAETKPVSRPSKLVRRVTFAAELERRRKCARIEARRIFKKMQALSTTVCRLKRKHRELRTLGAGAGIPVGNKENMTTS
ncbi:hypothetical protein C8R46DRAFT_1354025 [Mycena filopes]|nr:hypothetical protein C8R46DRAFT_1354024 [Mycena filopes]KAJ7160312.1 hypothetical protein C8R46DRAFT_1354025 [Mycena filopes]